METVESVSCIAPAEVPSVLAAAFDGASALVDSPAAKFLSKFGEFGILLIESKPHCVFCNTSLQMASVNTHLRTMRHLSKYLGIAARDLKKNRIRLFRRKLECVVCARNLHKKSISRHIKSRGHLRALVAAGTHSKKSSADAISETTAASTEPFDDVIESISDMAISTVESETPLEKKVKSAKSRDFSAKHRSDDCVDCVEDDYDSDTKCVTTTMETCGGGADYGGARSYGSWNKQQTAEWLDDICLDAEMDAAVVEAYRSQFLDNEITGAILPDLDRDALQRIGISKVGHLVVFENAIRELVVGSREDVDAAGHCFDDYADDGGADDRHLLIDDMEEEDKVDDDSDSDCVKESSTSISTGFKFDESVTLEQIRSHMEEFASERDWEQYHTPRNLLLALTGEIGELCELFQWRGEVAPGVPEFSDSDRQNLADELSDVLVYVVRLADRCHVDLPKAAFDKMRKNAEKYPAHLVRGSSKKYTEYQ